MRVSGANGISCERGRARCSHVVLSTSVARRGCYGVMRDPWCGAQSGRGPGVAVLTARPLACVSVGGAWSLVTVVELLSSPHVQGLSVRPT